MSHKFRAVNKIPQRKKYLVFGWCREEGEKHHQSYPQLVSYCSLLYFATNNDLFEAQKPIHKMHIKLEVRADEIVSTAGLASGPLQIIKGTNQVQTGVHEWLIKIVKKGLNNSIGVISNDDEKYLFNVAKHPWRWKAPKSDTGMEVDCKDGDEVRLTLNCNDWTLKLVTNEESHHLMVKKSTYTLLMTISGETGAGIANSLPSEYKLKNYCHIV